MNLQELRQKLAEAGFSEQVSAKLKEILDQAIARGSLDNVTKQQMMDLIDLDVEAGLIEADAMEKMALALNSFADENERIVEMNDEAEAKIEADVEDVVKQVGGTNNPPAAPTM
jgi:hypothetical protein